MTYLMLAIALGLLVIGFLFAVAISSLSDAIILVGLLLYLLVGCVIFMLI
jgi:hypothetical protein